MNNSMLSKNLVFLRKKTGKTQSQLAEILNISRAAYGSYEQGTREPDTNMLLSIAKFYNVTIDYLIGVEKQESIEMQEIIDKNTVVSIGRSGHRHIYEISDKDAAIVDAFLERMSKKKQ